MQKKTATIYPGLYFLLIHTLQMDQDSASLTKKNPECNRLVLEGELV